MRFIRVIVLGVFCLWLNSCISVVPVDVAMVDGELYFILQEEYQIDTIQVCAVDTNRRDEKGKTMWALRTDGKSDQSVMLNRIKYGQVFQGASQVVGPFQLEKNTEYIVGLVMPDKFAREVFIITDDNKIVLPRRKDKGESAE